MKKHKIISSIIIGTMVLTFLSTPIHAASLTEQLEQSNARQATAKYQVNMTQNTINGIEQEIVKINEEVNRINSTLSSINNELSKIEGDIAKKQDELNIAEAKKQEQENSMNDRIRAMYMYGDTSLVEFVFSASDFSDLITKLDMSRYIMSADKKSLTALDETKKIIEEKKQNIETNRLKTVEKKTEQEIVLNQQAQILSQKDQLLAQNITTLNEYQAIENAESITAADIEYQLQAYHAQQQTVAENNAYINEDSNNESETTTPNYSSSYVWPCGGEITSEYGWRIHPIWGDSRFHTGVDIGASSGTPVACAGNGTVISAGWNGGYGNCVIVDIGNGLTVVYAHLSAMSVSDGETVSAGQTVGAVGSTGDSTGSHLHYEVRQYGSAINPYI